MTRSWLIRPHPHSQPRRRLFCLPHAGGGAAMYVQWQRFLPADIEIVAMQPPGRENRVCEPPVNVFASLIDTLVTAMQPYLDIPFAVFGHSMGATLAFEIVRELRRRGGPLPCRLFLSGRQAPMRPEPDLSIRHLPDAEFARQLDRRYGGIPKLILDSPGFLQLFLPILRADLALLASHVYHPEAPLDLPFSLLCGRDDPHVTESDLEAWRELTRAEVTIRRFPGAHFYFQNCRDELLQAIQADLEITLPVRA